ncbi:hypothetical protein K7432_013720 [Basidiobolus ranarum]|uniref:Serine aminopeptidase S33 domain-containing protein n=1 Tax=Basidiobolus ranarum TaxID=34480 RepID=A0ABR2WIR5_9FUNG
MSTCSTSHKEEHSIITADGLTLGATLTHKKTEEVIIICHGMLDTRRSNAVNSLTNLLPYSSLAFDFRGNGDSEGRTRYGNYYEEVEDLRAVIEYARNVLKFTVNCIIGHSKGGSVVLLYGSKYNDIPLIVNISARYFLDHTPIRRFGSENLSLLEKQGWFVWKKYGLEMEREYIISNEDLQERFTTDMSKAKPSPKSKIRYLTIHGDSDKVVPVDDALEYHKLLGPEPRHELIIQKGATHFFNSETEQRELSSTIIHWITRVHPHL